MKIIHTSDLHINSPLTATLPSAKVAERKREIFSNFARLADEATRVGASAIIIAGDLFDSDRLSAKDRDRVISTVERHPNIAFFYLSGNHEGDALTRAAELPENLKIFGDRTTVYETDEARFIGFCDTSAENFSSIVTAPDKVNILVLHGELRDRSASGGIIGRKDIEKSGVRYVALGHYHSYSEEAIGDSCVAVYSGTPEGRGFDETGDCGYVLIEVKGEALSHRFVKFAKRTIHIKSVDITGAHSQYEIEARVTDAVRGIPKDDVVRITLTGKYTAKTRKDTVALEYALGASFYHFEVKDDSRLFHNPKEYENDKSLKGEFIRLVMSKGDLSDEEKERIIKCGLSALAGESFDE